MNEAHPSAKRSDFQIPSKQSPVQYDDDLIDTYTNLVYKIARKIYGRVKNQIELEDLVAYGNSGLLEASQRYDDAYNVAFSTFAYYRIRGAIIDGCRKEGLLKKRRSNDLRDIMVLNEYLDTYYSAHSDLAPPVTLKDCIASVTEVVSDSTMALMLNRVEARDLDELPDKQLEMHQLGVEIKKVLSQLPGNEQQVVQRYYFEDHTMQAIADDIGLSKSAVSRIHGRALKRLRKLIDSTELDDPHWRGIRV